MKLLENLKILDFTTLLPGPFATFMLADMGAEVLKITAPGKKDLVLESGPKNSDGITANKVWLNNNKKEINLDLKGQNGIEKIKSLINDEGYNCIIEQFRPGVMKRLGLDYETVKSFAPNIIYLSLSGYGQYGEYRDRAGHDINYLSLSGLMSYSGRKEVGPVLNGMQVADIAAAQNAVIGILAANNKRMIDGKGTYIDVSILDSVIPFNAMTGVGAMMSGENPEREGDWLNGGSLYDFYETSDGQYISVGALEPKFWKRFCEKMGLEDWIEAGCVCSDAEEKKKQLRKMFREGTRKYWESVFSDADACVEPVLNLDEALTKSGNARERQSIVDVNGTLIYGNPIKFKR